MSKEKAFNLNTKKIDLAKVINPHYTHNINLTKKQRDRKREIIILLKIIIYTKKIRIISLIK